jgi:hypothetical protein
VGVVGRPSVAITPAPNKALHQTAYSLHSSVAPTFGLLPIGAFLALAAETVPMATAWIFAVALEALALRGGHAAPALCRAWATAFCHCFRKVAMEIWSKA